MPTSNSRNWARFQTFAPSEGTVVCEPPGDGVGYWAGAPGVTHDASSGMFYLSYRLRRQKGDHPDRGAETRIACSSNGVEFEDIWSGHKATLDSTSIERCALIRMPAGHWGLFISYVDPADRRWRIDLVENDDPAGFDLTERTGVLTAKDIGAEGVKDPFVCQIAGLYHMVVSYATGNPGASGEEMHRTNDAYDTGLIKSRTGLATSDDGTNWTWDGEILGPSATGWDCYCSRISTLWQEDGVWLALYDGSASADENYEERCGLAFSLDLRQFHRVTRRGPLMHQPNASGSLRYFDVVELPEATFYYYETARADGSHELRVLKRDR